MSEYKFSCPGCGKHLTAGADDAGRQIMCPECQSAVVIPSNPPPPSLGRRIGRVFGFLILLALGCFAAWRVVLNNEVNSQFARIRAAGYPASGAEWNAWRAPVPDAENGALVIAQAFAMVQTFPDSRSNEVAQFSDFNRTNKWSAATRELVAAYLQTNAPALAKVREALLLSRFRYPVDATFALNILLPHLSKLKKMAILAEMETALDAEEGRAEQWLEPVELQLKLAGTLDDEPILLSHLVRNSIVRIAAKSAERSLNRISPGDEACRRLQAAFTRAGGTNLLPLALAGERAMAIPYFRMSWKEMRSASQSDGTSSQPQEPQRYSGKPCFPLWLTGFLERDLSFYLQSMEKGISLAALAPPESLAMSNYMNSVGAVAEKRFYFDSGMLVMGLSKVTVQEATLQANTRLAATAFAVERFRLAKGRLPNSLAELAPQFLDAIPTDPFDGQSLRYRLLARGYIIYSVGADGQDDGGREPPENKKSTDTTTYDITFIVER